MENTMPFGELLEELDKLPLGDQEVLRDILARRIIERRRDELAREIKDARKEHQRGQSRPVTPDELIKEIIS